MLLRRLTLLCFLVFSTALAAQMTGPNGTVSYGNEWLEAGRTYLKFQVGQDGVYRIPAAEIRAAGLDFTGAEAWRLQSRGVDVPVLVNENGVVFYGEQHRYELDAFLFDDPESSPLNTRYSMYNDTVGYYLSAADQTSAYQPATATASGQPLTTITRTAEVVFNANYTKNFFRSSGSSIFYSHYDIHDGFGQLNGNELLSSDGRTTSTVAIPLPQNSGGAAELTVRFGLAFESHNQAVTIDGQAVGTVTGSQWSVEEETYAFTASGESTNLTMTGSGSDRDKASIAWARVTYPALPVATGLRSFIMPASRQDRIVILSDWGEAAGAVQLVAPTTGTVVNGTLEDGAARFVLPADGGNVEYHLVNTTTVSNLSTPTVLSPASILPTDRNADYLILTSNRLAGPELDAYVAYRSSPAGGSHGVHVAYVEDVYEQFGYGVDRHPQALRNYLAAAQVVAPDLNFLFIIGKGRELWATRTAEGLTAQGPTTFVPSIGFPASDNLLSAPSGSRVPTLATGRLANVDAAEIGVYLDKIRGVESQRSRTDQTIAERAWMKQVMHLGGGVTPGEQSSIRNRLMRNEQVTEQSRWGTNVTSVFRTSTDPIETSRTDRIFDRINSGVALLTFFGHSSTQSFDFNIDNPENYENKDRYPFMMSLGCYSGDAFGNARSISERFIFLPDGGAVAFAASKGVGYISALGNWSNRYYDLISNEMYGRGIGEVLRTNIAAFAGTSNFTEAILLEQFALSGDPAYTLHPLPGTDIVVDESSVRFSPEVIPAQNDSFTVNLTVTNIGDNTERDSMTLSFAQELPSGDILPLRSYRMMSPFYDTELSLKLPNLGIQTVGLNRIFVTVDSDNNIRESPAPRAEANNELRVGGRRGVPLTFIANTARVAFPPEYGVVSGPLELIANSTNPLAPERDYILQVATNSNFSQLITEDRITAPGGVIRHDPAINWQDSTTYYWRISPDSTTTEGAGYIWSESNFTYVNDRPATNVGWAMQHEGQTINGQFDNVLGRADQAGWTFSRTTTDIRVVNGNYQSRQVPRFEFNGQRFNSPFPWYIGSAVTLIVIDSVDSYNWLQTQGDGAYNTPARRGDAWMFNTSEPEGRDGLMRFIQQGVPEGKYVILYSTQRSGPDYYNSGWLQDSVTYGQSVFDVLEAEGALLPRGLADRGSVPYIFVFQKGFGAIGESLAVDADDVIDLEVGIGANWDQGSWSSGPVGPSDAFTEFDVAVNERDVTEADSIQLHLFAGATPASMQRIRTVPLGLDYGLSYRTDLSGQLPAGTRYVSAQLNFIDQSARTSPTVEHFYLDYQRTGDVAVSPGRAYALTDSLAQGQEATLTVGYENISRTAMDSLLVELRTISRNNEETIIRRRQPPLPPGASGEVSYNLPTLDFDDNFRFQLVLNPEEDQPESVVFNNTLTRGVAVSRDKTAPVMDLFFDGQRINDGDLVSSRPEILIQLRDDNPYLLLDDTSAYSIELVSPSGVRERMRFSDERVAFFPAADADNTAEILVTPELLEDGEYTLTVIGQDRSDNAAGRFEKQQRFEVVNQQLVSNVLAYPNPFTTQTQFVYTLTGSTPPSMFRIQIMTVSGRVVRDIDLLDTETLKVGTHRTNFIWDGTDEYGDQLANGVYLYRVLVAGEDGQELDKYDTGTDQFFENQLGKVVILR